jgi:hypothetical protein
MVARKVYHWDFCANKEGMRHYNLLIRALNSDKCKALFEYTIDYDIPTVHCPAGVMHRVIWWRVAEAVAVSGEVA